MVKGAGQVVNLDKTVWDDLRIPGTAVTLGASAPDLELFAGSSTAKIYTFDGATTMEEVYFTVQLPHSYLQGSTIKPHVHWCPYTTGTGVVKWQLEYSWQNVNGIFAAPTTISATTNIATASQWKHLITALPDISGAGKLISSMLVCRLFRNPSDAADTYAGDAGFLEFDLHIQKDRVGSVDEYTK